ncbi:Sulfotransferase, putative isoform 1 [Theobroma cacao]|uniref:Sulfotransferase, putative isoform 1 n=2 Tax=Theobroma cacao TaxID=3641 RepID=A0A061DZE2_THECC|nr:Sulfotransferase, putative isoform 1 [Theobroma cacao]EOX98134.1 Sulfotransferase, putative isoform 1 [Theobroma cacao]
MSQPVGPALPEKKPCIFYKLIVSSILQDKKLRIPHKFVKKYGDELSSIVTLATPSGRFWLVELKKDKRRMWFDSGWNVFVEYYSISVGYFLVFRYEGNSHFNVHVYNLAASEINYLSNGLNNSEELSRDEHVKNIEDGDLAEIMGSCPKCSSSYFLTDKDSDECLDRDRKKYKNSTSGADLKNLHQKNDMHDLQATFQLTQGKGFQLNVVELTSTADEGGPYFLNETQQITKKIKQETEPSKLHELKNFLYRVFLIDFTHPNSLKDIDEHEEELPAMNTPRNIARRWRDVTTEDKQSALHAAATFKPDNPFCRIILRPSYVYKGILLHIPRWFARKHLNGVNGTITLQVSEGKKWPVRCIYVDGHLKFCKGWAEFVLDNNLDEGDVCVFELINTEEIVLKVTIFRVLEDAGPVKKL